jgi:hypothetical protein
MLKQIDLPAGGPIPWPLGDTVDTTFLPWQTGGYFPAGTPIRAVRDAPGGERLVVQGKDYALLYCALPAGERTTTLIRTAVVLGTIVETLPDICTGARRDVHCPSGVAKIYTYRVALDERLTGTVPDTIRYLDVLHATWQATALAPQPGMRVLLFLRPASDQAATVANLPPDPVQAYWFAAPDAAYLVEDGAVRWMENPPDKPIAIARDGPPTGAGHLRRGAGRESALHGDQVRCRPGLLYQKRELICMEDSVAGE